MGSSWINQLGPKFNNNYLYKRQKRRCNRGQDHVKTEQTGVMYLQAKEGLDPLEPLKRQGTEHPLESLKGAELY